jgi:hypothetical protein
MDEKKITKKLSELSAIYTSEDEAAMAKQTVCGDQVLKE